MVELYNIFPSDSLHIEAYGSDLWARGPKNNIQWYFNSVLIPGAIDTLFHPLNTGIYTVKNILNTNFGSCGTLSKPFEVFCSVTIQQTNVPCDHSCVGEAIVHINSHATPTISWSNGSSDSLIQQLCEGMYIVSVNDSAGCNVVDSVKIIIDNPVVLNTVAYGSHCFNECNGSLYLFPSGGNGIYTWKINNIDTTIISYNSICAGDYLIQLNDSAGCVDSKMVTISNPSPIIISQTSLIEPTCSGSCDGEIVVFVSGGVGNYYPRWVDIGFGYTHYSLCDTDYVFTVSDQNNCIEIDTFSISAALNLQNNLNVTAPTCVNSCDGQITITTTNGTLPYSYSWSNGQTGSTVSACTGNLTFTVTDSIGCNLTESVYLPPQDSVYFNLSIRGTNCIGCSDGKIYINPVSAHSPYSITWLPSIGVLHNDTISNLLAGNYFVCLTDNNSCVFCDSVFIMEDPTTISDLKSFSLINISPNPFHEYTTVTFSHSETDIYTISLKDISGRIIREYKNIPETINIGGAGLAVGFYFISILKNGRLQWNEKVLVY